jgi:hypothetical protein
VTAAAVLRRPAQTRSTAGLNHTVFSYRFGATKPPPRPRPAPQSLGTRIQTKSSCHACNHNFNDAAAARKRRLGTRRAAAVGASTAPASHLRIRPLPAARPCEQGRERRRCAPAAHPQCGPNSARSPPPPTPSQPQARPSRRRRRPWARPSHPSPWCRPTRGPPWPRSSRPSAPPGERQEPARQGRHVSCARAFYFTTHRHRCARVVKYHRYRRRARPARLCPNTPHATPAVGAPPCSRCGGGRARLHLDMFPLDLCRPPPPQIP